MEEIKRELDELINEGEDVVISTKWDSAGFGGKRVNKDVFISWRAKALSLLKIIDDNSTFVFQVEELKDNSLANASAIKGILVGVKDYISKGLISNNNSANCTNDNNLERIFKKFFRVSRQLKNRHDNRETICIEDEYDVQDLIHALLLVYYDDVRSEEWTPSYAGKSARMDFLLKNEQIVIEVKKTRKGLEDKELGDQLIVDVDRYKSHPDCKKLICFVFDPEVRIGNPEGIIEDLQKRHGEFLQVFIEPLR